MQQNNQKLLIYLKNGDKFIHEDELYTVYSHEGNMTEVFKKGKFFAWPNWNGKNMIRVNQVYL